MKQDAIAILDEKLQKVEAQKQYCKDHNTPFFAPETRCWSCGANIWKKITLEQACKTYITGCPCCNRSYCD
jgi:hypothetical protein